MTAVRRPRVRIYRDRAGGWRWDWQAANGRIIAASSEAYVKRTACIHGLELVTGGKVILTRWPGGYQQGRLVRLGIGENGLATELTTFIEVLR